MSTGSNDEVLVERRGGTVLVTMNRPKALNALTLGMCRTLDAAMREWTKDETVGAIVISGAGDKAFCAGGDVRGLYDTGRGVKGPDDLKATFFRDEYRLNRLVHRFPRAYVALMDGITMGGGVGMSVNGSHRVVTERTLFAMPETAIGLFPDVGATWFLNRCPGEIGLYLALTGTRLKAADLLYAGLATHYVPSERLAALTAALAETRWERGAERRQADEVVARFATDAGAAPLAAQRAAIDRCFAGDSVEGIFAKLAADGTEWATKTAETLRRMSPTSLKVTLRQLRIGRLYEIEEALALEYRLTQHVMENHDFFEGVRSVLVDKDHSPKWQPARVEELDDATVERYFASLGANELTFIE